MSWSNHPALLEALESRRYLWIDIPFTVPDGGAVLFNLNGQLQNTLQVNHATGSLIYSGNNPVLIPGPKPLTTIIQDTGTALGRVSNVNFNALANNAFLTWKLAPKITSLMDMCGHFCAPRIKVDFPAMNFEGRARFFDVEQGITFGALTHARIKYGPELDTLEFPDNDDTLNILGDVTKSKIRASSNLKVQIGGSLIQSRIEYKLLSSTSSVPQPSLVPITIHNDLIGGLIDAGNGNLDLKVGGNIDAANPTLPTLREIPIIKSFFARVDVHKDARTLLILVRPTVITPPGDASIGVAAAATTDDILDDTETDVPAASVSAAAPVPAGALIPLLDHLHVGGTLADSFINVDGNINSIDAAQILNTRIYAGVAPDFVFTPNLTSDAFSSSFTIAHINTQLFSNSQIAAANLGDIHLGAVDNSNNSHPFGLAALSIDHIDAHLPDQHLDLHSLTDPTDSQNDQDFNILLASSGAGG